MQTRPTLWVSEDTDLFRHKARAERWAKFLVRGSRLPGTAAAVLPVARLRRRWRVAKAPLRKSRL